MSLDKDYFDISYLDKLAYQDSIIHRLDSRAKVAATFVFIFVVVSFSKYEIAALIPYFFFPIMMIGLGEIPFMLIVKKIILVSPFAVLVGMFNPIFDQSPYIVTHEIMIAQGWISYLSLLIKFILTMSASLALIATASFPSICLSLQQFGVPRVFTTQLLFLYRYIFVLLDEVARVARAREMRTFGKKVAGLAVFVRIVGALFIRTVERAERIYQAMLSRGFQGNIVLMKKTRFSIADGAFIVASIAFCFVFRFYPVTDTLGVFALRLLQ
jgi:cobalt/nickel transport system permease protein